MSVIDNILGYWHGRWHRRQLNYIAERRPLEYAPYDLSRLRSLFDWISNHPWIEFAPFDAPYECPEDRARVFVRRDLDMRTCIDAAKPIADLDRDFGVPATWFVRVDGEDYDPAKDCRQLSVYLQQHGAPLGLHTSCYMWDDAFDRLKREIDLFVESFEAVPRFLSVHGTGVRQEQRKEFSKALQHRMEDFGLTHADCDRSLRNYTYSVGDSHFDASVNQRYIATDFRDIPLPYRHRGRDFLILNHPGYWRSDGGAETSVGKL